jgi:hypothetical protein
VGLAEIFMNSSDPKHRLDEHPIGSKSGIICSMDLINHGLAEFSRLRIEIRNVFVVTCRLRRHINVTQASPIERRLYFGK